MTHPELVERAQRWLRNSCGCALVVSETSAYYCNEIPDAMGWSARGYSILIECKISVSDWLRDQRKQHRRVSHGIGHARWYMASKGVLSGRDMPEGWGLLEVCGKVVRKVILPEKREQSAPSMRQELSLLVATQRRGRQVIMEDSVSWKCPVCRAVVLLDRECPVCAECV